MATDLDTFIAERRGTAFEYFQHDCAHVAADWVQARTGKDPMWDLRPILAEKHLLRALRAVRREGGFEAAAARRLGPPKPGLMAQRGDIVLTRSGRPIGRVSGYSFGICTGSHIVCPGDQRLEFLPLTDGVAAWAV